MKICNTNQLQKNQWLNPKKIHFRIHICNNKVSVVIWKHIQTIWNWKQKRIQCNTNVLLHKKSFLTPIMNFSSHPQKKTQCINDRQLRILPISPWFPTMNMNSNSQPIITTQPYVATLSYNDISFYWFFLIMTIYFCPPCPMVIKQFSLNKNQFHNHRSLKLKLIISTNTPCRKMMCAMCTMQANGVWTRLFFKLYFHSIFN
jgi:hypothetical protein